MNSNVKTVDWRRGLRSELEAVPALREKLDEWQGHATKPVPVVALIGGYNASKSSVVKRLLVDQGRAIPEWLEVAARPMTFRVDEVATDACILRDVPGMGGGDLEHDLAAESALQMVDAIVQVLLPILVTGKREATTDVWTGRSFHPDGWHYPEGVLTIALGASDLIANPEDGLEAFHKAVAAKKDELAALIRREGAGAQPRQVLAVAADPFGLVCDRADVTRADYDKDREWDGMADLGKLLAALPARLPSLRADSEDRYLCSLGVTYRRALETQVSRTKDRLEVATNEQARIAGWLKALNAIEQAAEADLQTLVQDVISDISRSGATGKEFVSKAKERMGEAIEIWAQRVEDKCNKLTDQLVAEFGLRAGRPTLRSFDGIGDVGDAPSDARSVADQVTTYTDAGKKFWNAIVTGVDTYHGGKLSKIREELAQGNGSKLRKLFRSNEHKRLVHLAKADKVLTGLAPAAMELGNMLVAEIQEQRSDAEKARKREELRAQVDEAVRKMARLCLDGDPLAGTPGLRADLTVFAQKIEGAGPGKAEIDELEALLADTKLTVARVSMLLGAAHAENVGRSQRQAGQVA